MLNKTVQSIPQYVAAPYGQGGYTTCEYNTAPSSACAIARDGGAAGNNGGLANTGIWLMFAISVACLIIFIALIVRFWRRKATKPTESIKS